MADHFTLDTSGVVPACKPTADPSILGPCGFHDLDAFTQGTLGKASEDAQADPTFMDAFYRRHGHRALAFSDWSPEALAMILADCAAFQHQFPGAARTVQDGRRLWLLRSGSLPGYPGKTLTHTLGDDGKVYLRAVA